jgi:SOS-response transcriptional repressor LexA
MNHFAIAPVHLGAVDWVSSQPVVLPQLTPVQIRIVAFIHRYQQMWGASPLYREIGQGCGLGSESAVAYQIARLVAAGVLRKPARLHRALRLTMVPVPTRVPAGAFRASAGPAGGLEAAS